MKITFLGTGTSQGVPVIACQCEVCRSADWHDKRLRTSALLTDDDGNNVIFDIGPDFRQQMLTNNVDHLDAILVTHAHRDHVGGLDDIRPFNWTQHRKMEIYANAEALQSIRHDYHYIFEPHEFPGLPEANLHDVGDCKAFTIGQFEFTPIKGMHKYLPVLGYRADAKNGKSVVYITDMNYIPEAEQEKLSNLDVLVINALCKEKHFSHFSLPEVLEIIRVHKPKVAYITHVSHMMGCHRQVESELPEGVHLAYDNLTVEI